MSDIIQWPERVSLAVSPTPIERLRRVSEDCGVEVHIKRDDLTGAALSGNKVRKLEFLMREALDAGARTVYTCGGVQSNHARATAVAAAKLGLRSRLFLRGKPPARAEGNVLLGRLAGAALTFITPEEYEDAVEVMTERARQESAHVYIIPEGGSNPLGSLGYARAAREIVQAERNLGFSFDAVVHAVGSGGTIAGLILGKKAFGLSAEVIGINICDDPAYFQRRVGGILREAAERYAPGLRFEEDEVRVLGGHVGPGYAISTAKQLETIRRVALTEGVFLDPVYSGKAFHGMLEEIRGGRLAGMGRILFIHTGGIFSLFARGEEMLGESGG